MSEKKENYELDIGDDLMAAALAAVDARMKPKQPDSDEMDAFSADLAIDDSGYDEDVEFEGDDVKIETDLDDDAFATGTSAETDDDGISSSFTTGKDDEIAFLHQECDRLNQELASAKSTNLELREQVDSALAQLRNQMGRTERNREKMRRLNQDADNATEARTVAENRAKALKATVEKLQEDLEKSLERRKRDLKEQREQDTQRIVTGFLPVMDHLQLALLHAEADPETLLQGIQMVRGQFLKALMSNHVVPIQSNPGTTFDPHVHEAIEKVDDPDWEPNTIVDTAQVGYTYRKRLVRPARVVVCGRNKGATEKIVREEADHEEVRETQDHTDSTENDEAASISDPNIDEPSANDSSSRDDS